MEKINAEVFITVAKLRSFRKAADMLGYTQAGISYIINSMEEQAGIKLFEREFGGVKLTQDGENLLPVMKQLYSCEQQVNQQIDKLKGLDTGHIRLLSFNTVIVCYLPQILRDFKAKYPGIDIELLACDSPAEAIEEIRNGNADCAFVPITKTDDVELRNLTVLQDVIVVADDHPLTKKKKVTKSDLEKYPFIGCPEEEDPYVYDMAEKMGIKLNRIITVNNDYGCFSMISHHLGFGIYSDVMVKKSMFPVKGLPLSGDFTTPVSLAIRSYGGISLAAKAFVEHILAQDWDKID